jgi:hypothetical protein
MNVQVERKLGIISVLSTVSLSGYRGLPVYSAIKLGLDGFTCFWCGKLAGAMPPLISSSRYQGEFVIYE